jgi:methionyl-tRNA synthetase
VFYVWFDAPLEYIGATWEWADAKAKAENRAPNSEDWERWWRAPGANDTTYIEFMGKDNVPFHTVGFPCTLFGVNEKFVSGKWVSATDHPWKLVDRLKGFNWLNYYGGKFSTSSKRGVFMDQALDIAPADVWRWRLIAAAPEGSDSAFTWEEFQLGVNADLANVLGNFVNRITRFCAARFDSKVPAGGASGPAEKALYEALETRLANLAKLHDEMEFRKAAAETRAIWVAGNEYLQNAAPWTAIKTDAGAAAMGVRTGLNLCLLFAEIAAPFMPQAAAAIAATFGKGEANLTWPTGPVPALLSRIGHGQPIAPPDVLFRKIEDTDVEAWKARFGGQG